MINKHMDKEKIEIENPEFIWKPTGIIGKNKKTTILKRSDADKGKEEAINYCKKLMLCERGEER